MLLLGLKFHRNDTLSSDNSIEDSLSPDEPKSNKRIKKDIDSDFLEDLNDRYVERSSSNKLLKNILNYEENLNNEIEEIVSSIYDSNLYENKTVDMTVYEKNVL
jgi:hypothetical protein